MTDKELLKIINKSIKKKGGNYSKKIVALVVFLNTIFATATLYVFLKVGSEPTGLIIAWFGFTTGELWLLHNIKKAEVKEEGKREEYEDRLEKETFK